MQSKSDASETKRSNSPSDVSKKAKKKGVHKHPHPWRVLPPVWGKK